METKPIILDGVRFYDCAEEKAIEIESTRQIVDVAMIPLRGDYVKFGYSDDEYIVIDRHFHFRQGGVVSVLVNVQPAGRNSEHPPNENA